jgi:hypothetical protein
LFNRVLTGLWLVSLVSLISLCIIKGGWAVEGKIEDGRFFLGGGKTAREVPQSIFVTSAVLSAICAFLTEVWSFFSAWRGGVRPDRGGLPPAGIWGGVYAGAFMIVICLPVFLISIARLFEAFSYGNI